MLTTYTYRYANLVGNFVACGGFACRPVRFQVCNHAAVTDLPVVRYRHFLVHNYQVGGINRGCTVGGGVLFLELQYVSSCCSWVILFHTSRWRGECVHQVVDQSGTSRCLVRWCTLVGLFRSTLFLAASFE